MVLDDTGLYLLRTKRQHTPDDVQDLLDTLDALRGVLKRIGEDDHLSGCERADNCDCHAMIARSAM